MIATRARLHSRRSWRILACGLLGERLERGGARRAAREEDRLDGVNQNAEIQPQGQMLDEIEVVTHFLGLFREVVGVAVPDLCPPSHARTDERTERVVRDLFEKESEIGDRMRTRADEIEVSTED